MPKESITKVDLILRNRLQKFKDQCSNLVNKRVGY